MTTRSNQLRKAPSCSNLGHLEDALSQHPRTASSAPSVPPSTRDAMKSSILRQRSNRQLKIARSSTFIASVKEFSTASLSGLLHARPLPCPDVECWSASSCAVCQNGARPSAFIRNRSAIAGRSGSLAPPIRRKISSMPPGQAMMAIRKSAFVRFPQAGSAFRRPLRSLQRLACALQHTPIRQPMDSCPLP
jgi:hypothetical protein